MNVGTAHKSKIARDPCGDVAGFWHHSGGVTLGLADGLGHGPLAAVAARAAIEFVADHLSISPRILFRECGQAISHTRGVALAIAAIEPVGETEVALSYSALGEIGALVLDGNRRVTLPASRGVVGEYATHPHEEQMTISRTAIVILHSDGVHIPPGLPEREDVRCLSAEPGAAVLLSESILETDDAAIIVCKDDAQAFIADEDQAAPPPGSLRTLIIDDRPSTISVVLEEMALAGLQADWSHVESLAGINRLAADRVDVAFLSASWPHFTAPQALRALRERWPDLIVIEIGAVLEGEGAGRPGILRADAVSGAVRQLMSELIRRGIVPESKRMGGTSPLD